METCSIDLHMHSTASDGTVEPAALMKMAEEAGLSAVALTDHDTVSGVAAARSAAGQYGMEFIAGCETAVQYPGGELHIVGLWVPDNDAGLLSFLQGEKDRRRIRNDKMLERLSAMGVKLPQGAIKEENPHQAVGRPHIARALMAEGYVDSVQAAFEKYLGSRGAAYVPRQLLTPEEGVASLSSFGATVLIAHPRLSVTMTENRLDSLIRRLKPKGLTGLEVYHTSHGPEDVKLCLAMAERHGLLASGGSDFHGPGKPDARIGRAFGGASIPRDLLEKMKEARVRRGLPV